MAAAWKINATGVLGRQNKHHQDISGNNRGSVAASNIARMGACAVYRAHLLAAAAVGRRTIKQACARRNAPLARRLKKKSGETKRQTSTKAPSRRRLKKLAGMAAAELNGRRRAKLAIASALSRHM